MLAIITSGKLPTVNERCLRYSAPKTAMDVSEVVCLPTALATMDVICSPPHVASTKLNLLAIPLRSHGFYKSGSGLFANLLLAISCGRFYAIRSNEGESSGWGGRAGEERNGSGGDGNQGTGGDVGGDGHREGIGNERRGSGGRSHGGDNGDDDNNDRRGWVGYIEDERRPMVPITNRMAEILLPLNVQIIAALESLDLTRLSARARVSRVASLGFNSGALVCFSASIRQRGTNPRLASVLSWIGLVATIMGFISMIAMALWASFSFTP